MCGDDHVAGIPSREALEAAHSFPCRFSIKAVGVNHATFVTAVREAAVHVAGDASQVSLAQRESANGTYVSVTVEIPADTAETVRTLYYRLQAVADLKTLL